VLVNLSVANMTDADEIFPIPIGSSKMEASYTIDDDNVSLLDEDEAIDPMKTARSASWFSSFFNLANTICGAGILGLPYAFANTGWLLGFFFLLLSACFSWVGMHLLTLCCAKTGFPSSLYSVTRPMHKHAPTFVDSLILFQLFGAAVAYLIIVGDLMPEVAKQLSASQFWQDRTTWVVTGFLTVTPFSIPHNIDFLKYTSGCCIFFLIATAVILMLYTIDGTGLNPCADQDIDDDSHPCQGHEFVAGGQLNGVKALEVMSIFIFGYCCQITTFPIINELANGTVKKFDSVSAWSLIFATFLYVVASIAGYVTYGDSIKSDLLLNYPAVGIMTAARMMISFVVLFSFPLQINPARRSGMTIMHNYMDGGKEPSNQSLQMRYYGFTAVFLAISLALSLAIKDLGVVCKVIGATGGTMIMFIMPGISYLYHFPLKEALEGDSDDEGSVSTFGGRDRNISKSLLRDQLDEEEEQEANALPQGGKEGEANITESDLSGIARMELTRRNTGANQKHLTTDHTAALAVYLSRPACDDALEDDLRSLGLQYEMEVPSASLVWRRVAWTQLVVGCIICPVSLVMIFLGGGD